MFGTLVGSFYAVLLLVSGLLTFGQASFRELLGTSLFFGINFTILSTYTGPVYREAAADLRRLGPILALRPEDVECLALGLTRATPKQLWITVAIALVVGLTHSWLLGHQHLPLSFLIPQTFATLSLWVVMLTTLTKMIINAVIFSKLGNVATPDLLRPSRQAPFGSAAIRPALFLIGILCAYSVLAISDGNPFNNGVWFGFISCVVSLIGIVILPMRGIRTRVESAREELLGTLDRRLEALNSSDLGAASAETLRDMDTILDMRERVSQAPSWPVDLAGLRRIVLYIVLPPLTWSAAALVEMAIDGAVGG